MRRAVVVGIGFVAIGAVAAGCGSGASSNGVATKSPTQIFTTALDSLKSAQSVLIAGTLTSGSESITLHTTSFHNGDINGSFSEKGKSFDVIKVGANDYIKAPSSFYEASGVPASTADKMGGVWISIPDSQFGVGSEFGLSGFATSLLNNHGTITAGTTSTVSGQPVVSVKSSKGGTLYVATTGTAYPVEITAPKSSGSGSITFTDWNQGSPPKVPAGAKTAASFG